MKLTQTQRVGLIVVLGVFTEESLFRKVLFNAGDGYLSKYEDLSEEDQKDLLKGSKEGLETITKLLGDNL